MYLYIKKNQAIIQASIGTDWIHTHTHTHTHLYIKKNQAIIQASIGTDWIHTHTRIYIYIHALVMYNDNIHHTIV